MTETRKDRRRRDLARMKARAVRVRPDHPKAERYAERLAVCSCWMCGNPRRHRNRLAVKLTMQERRADPGGDED